MDVRFTTTHAITEGLTAIDFTRGFLQAAAINEKWVARMSHQALLLEAHHTTHIEGTQLTLEQSAQVWAGEKVPKTQADDVRELLNYRHAFELVSGYLLSGDPITEGLIREIHKRLVQGVRGDQADPGSYRKSQNHVVSSVTKRVIYTPPPPEDVAPLMRDLIDWLRVESPIHPVLVAGIAQFQLVHIHPFLDGNGRTSRLLSTLCLYRAGYDFKRLFSISEYYDRERTAFYNALQGVREHGMDLTGWLEYFVHGLGTQLTEVNVRVTRAMLNETIGREVALNSRQQLALDHVIVHKRLTLGDVQALHPTVSRRTLQRDLKQMLEKGVLVEIGSGPTDPNRHYQLKTK